MKAIVVLFGTFLTLAAAQFPFADDELVRPWNGPLANHQLGLPPGDTAEVAAAKQAHLKAFKDALAVLPELPPEERYRKSGLPLNAVLALMQKAHQQANVPTEPFVYHNQPVAPTPPPQNYVPEHHFIPQPNYEFVPEISHHPVYTVLAEEIPRSPFGEVPEVYAARIAHLKAYNEARAIAG